MDSENPNSLKSAQKNQKLSKWAQKSKLGQNFPNELNTNFKNEFKNKKKKFKLF